MKSHHFLFLFLLSPLLLFSQEEATEEIYEKTPSQTELGINVTNTLAGFFNSGGSDFPIDPYLFSLKFAKPNSAFRIGLNFSFNDRSEFLSTGNRDGFETTAATRIGYEWRRHIDKRFTLYYGFDGVANFESEVLKFDSFGFDDIASTEQTIGFGGGPIFGVQFWISKKVALSTETSFYGIVQRHKKTQEVGNNIEPIVDQSTDFVVEPMIPNSLYFIFVF